MRFISADGLARRRLLTRLSITDMTISWFVRPSMACRCRSSSSVSTASIWGHLAGDPDERVRGVKLLVQRQKLRAGQRDRQSGVRRRVNSSLVMG